MAVSREEAIQLAAQFANANSYRVEPDFEGLVWRGRDQDGARPVKLVGVVWVKGDGVFDDEWAVRFTKMLPPEIAAENPASIIVTVHPETGACEIPELI